jgi:hypothetical protein
LAAATRGLQSSQVLAAASVVGCSTRSFAKLSAPGLDPLEVLRETSLKKGLCDRDGFRVAGVHWVFSVAVNAASPDKPPNLRTLGIQRVTDAGIDFVVKNGGASSRDLSAGHPMSILLSQGKYVPGEKAEQWRGEGHAEKIPLSQLLDKIPRYTITNMVATKRFAAERSEGESEERILMKDKSHMTEVVQQARMELENGQVDEQELESSISAYRFCPDRMERMKGGPDSVLWERWEWSRADAGDCPEGTLAWNEPVYLLPH